MDDAGRFPVWNETLTIKFETEQVAKQTSLKIVCFDEDLIMDSHVGQAVFMVSDLLGDKKWIELKYRGKKAAEILIEANIKLNPLTVRKWMVLSSRPLWLGSHP